jgi:uncharacterized glyoxalase superfamily protein PhnB
MPNKPITPVIFPMLSVKSVEETFRYYTHVLGFVPGMTMPGPGGKWAHAEASFGGVHLMFGRIDNAGMDPTLSKTNWAEQTKKGTVGGGCNLYINIGLASIDNFFKMVRERGAKTVNEPETKYWGDRVFSIADPDGYLITFAETVAEFDPSKAPR